MAGGVKCIAQEHVHLIGHSAGSALISKAAEKLRGSGKVVHTTFLDPYAPNRSWKELYGGDSEWSDSYIAQDVLPWTQPTLPNAYNVDVTRVDPDVDVNEFGHAMSSHSWPIRFYTETLKNPNFAPNRGFSRSKEGGGWAQRGSYLQGEDPVVLGGGTPLPEETGSVRQDDVVQVENSTYFTSDTGTVNLTGTTVDMTTGSPVWISMLLDVEEAVNFVTFDADFTSDAGAEGLLALYWDETFFGLIDERYASDDLENYLFMLPGTFDAGTYSFVLRLDSYTDIDSGLFVDNIRTGLAVPEPSAFIMLGMGTVGLLVYAWRRRRLKSGSGPTYSYSG